MRINNSSEKYETPKKANIRFFPKSTIKRRERIHNCPEGVEIGILKELLKDAKERVEYYKAQIKNKRKGKEQTTYF